MKEYYINKPADVEAWPHGNVTDLILRRNIQQETDDEGGEHWECEEVQLRADGRLSVADVQAQFDRWWSAANGPGLEKLRNEKLADLSVACNATIISGVDVVLPDGKHHFSLGIEDQLNLMSLQAMVMAGQTEVAYHADGEECRFYTAAEFRTIAAAATNWKLYHESYYNAMRSYIYALDDAEQIKAITYGTPIPDDYQTDVLRLLTQQMGGSNET